MPGNANVWKRRLSDSVHDLDGEEDSIPEGWIRAPLGEVVTPSKAKIEPAAAGSLPYVGLEHIEAHSTRLLGHGVARDVRSTKTAFHSGDVLYGKLRPYLAKVVVAPFDGIASTDILVFPGSPLVDSRYLMRYLSQPSVAAYANHRSSGVQLPRVSFSALAELPFPLPPAPEQGRIMETLEGLLGKISSCRDRLDRIPRILGRFRQAVLAAACSGRLTEEWRAERGITEFSPKQASGDGLIDHFDLPELPPSWRWERMDSVAEIQGGIQKQPKRTPKENGFPYLRVANVLRGRVDARELKHMELFGDELATYRLEPGDLLIVEGNGSLTEIGRSAVWHGEIENCVHQNHIIRVRPTGAVPRFLDYFWNSALGIRNVAAAAVTTSGLYSLSTKKVAMLPVPVPDSREQGEIVRRVEALLSLANGIRARVGAALDRTGLLSQSVLARAFRGELVPTEAELATAEGRDYETAQELLARIRESLIGPGQGTAPATGPIRGRGKRRGVSGRRDAD